MSIQIDTDVPVEIKFYRNRDYSEEEKSKILIDVSSKDYELKWKDGSIIEVILNPVKRKITLETVKIEENKKKLGHKITNLTRAVNYGVITARHYFDISTYCLNHHKT